jgi:Ca2+/Na+ antiporter
MAMEKYLERHEAFVRQQLGVAGEGIDWAGLARFHRTQIEYLQHERLVHLLVTLFFGLCLLLTAFFFVLHPQLAVGVLLVLLLALVVPYVAHYYKLENGVQRWYHLANEIERRAGNVSWGDPGR